MLHVPDHSRLAAVLYVGFHELQYVDKELQQIELERRFLQANFICHELFRPLIICAALHQQMGSKWALDLGDWLLASELLLQHPCAHVLLLHQQQMSIRPDPDCTSLPHPCCLTLIPRLINWSYNLLDFLKILYKLCQHRSWLILKHLMKNFAKFKLIHMKVIIIGTNFLSNVVINQDCNLISSWELETFAN